ncbi:MAG: S9 family peptidase [Verrucomicrobia bacterium]|nr:S9 family peptidase [Verrucomicrobiota bacterium]
MIPFLRMRLAAGAVLPWAVTGLLSWSAATAATPTSPPPPTIEQLFGLPQVRQPRVSPDGRRIAFLFPHEKKLALGVFDRSSGESNMVLRGEDESIFSFFWKGPERIVFLADVAGNESFFIGATDLTGRKVLRLAESQRLEDNLVGTFATIVDELRADPARIVVAGYFTDNVENALYLGGSAVVTRLNVQNRARSTVFEFRDSDRTVRLVADNTGALRVRGRLVGREILWEHRPNDGDSFREIARHAYHGYQEDWQPLAFAADNVTLWMISRQRHDQGALFAYNTKTGQLGEPLFVPPAGELDDDLVTTPDRKRLLGIAYETDRRHYHWFDADRAALMAKLENTFAGSEVRITSQSDDQNVKLIWVAHDREPGTYFVLDEKAGSLALFKRSRNLDPAQLQPRRPIQYQARDGVTIHGYLTLPAGATGRRVPLVVHPHGGPFGVRDSWGFDADAQFLASRGYAVLQPNYRGSGGYGRAFLDKGRHQWGRAMQDDLSDGVKWAIAEGLADPARVAIYGASYGGYATLAGLTLTPELYCCGVNYVGASDLEITFKHRGDDAYIKPGDFNYQTEWVGPSADYRAATSPINLVERIRVPTLHAYGEKDPRVKIDHWTRLEAQLKKHGKPYESVAQRKQGHGFRDEKASVGFYGQLDEFLATHLAPAGQVKIGREKVIEMPAAPGAGQPK